MDGSSVRRVLGRLADGEISVEEAEAELRFLPFADLGFAKVDHHRDLRTGTPEAVFGESKTPEQVAAIVEELLRGGEEAVLVTRASEEQYRAVSSVAPGASFHPLSRLVVVRGSSRPPDGVVAVASAGTSDLPVAEEAELVAEALGLKVERLRDVGVSGLHRLLSHHEALDRADVVIVVAGMEGALASIVSGMVSAPVVAVPTSVGYGAGAGGIAPLLAMLNTCAPGVAVVNIDNGFGAAMFAATILRRPR